MTHKKEQQIKIEGEFKPTVDCLCATRRRFVFIHKGMRDEFYLDGLNCEPYSFDAACQQLNREYQKKTQQNL
ncbi:MAG TPA: hypothetical protein DGV70_08300 [Faecalibacterium sp.]|nr:hypothetical protein [Faecalibacterium sp.]